MEKPVCRKCTSTAIVKAGFIRSKQRYKCQRCKCRFLLSSKLMYDELTQLSAMALYTDGTCIRAVARFFKVSHVTIQRWIRKLGKINTKPLPLYTPCIEIDELCSYVKSKKKRRWLWVAVCRVSKKILAFQVGSRGKKTLLKLYYKIIPIQTDMYFTDKYFVYKNVLPKEKHSTTLGGTNTVEGVNTSIRRYLSRFHRRSVCYNKSDYMLYLSMNLLSNKMW